MDRFTADVSLGGDRNHVVTKRDLTVAEIQVLQAIHGPQGVAQIQKQPQGGTTRAKENHHEIKDFLEKTYGRTSVGPDSDKRPVLVRVFPGWPNINLPASLKDAGIAPELVKGSVEETEDTEVKPVGKKTYWKDADSGTVGITEKGEFLPEHVTRIDKAEHDKLLQESEDPDMTE